MILTKVHQLLVQRGRLERVRMRISSRRRWQFLGEEGPHPRLCRSMSETVCPFAQHPCGAPVQERAS
jgi:hypothetical protein